MLIHSLKALDREQFEETQVQSSHFLDPVAAATADIKRPWLWQFQAVSYKITGSCLEDVPAFSLRVHVTNTHSLSEGT
jgi:hypothetical protein